MNDQALAEAMSGQQSLSFADRVEAALLAKWGEGEVGGWGCVCARVCARARVRVCARAFVCV